MKVYGAERIRSASLTKDVGGCFVITPQKITEAIVSI